MKLNRLKILARGSRINSLTSIFQGLADAAKTNGVFLHMSLACFTKDRRNRFTQKNFKFAACCALYSVFALQAAENPHSISANDKSACTNCHVTEVHYDKTDLLNSKNKQFDLSAFNNDGIAMCSGCHNADEGHKVGLKLDFDIPSDMPLNKRNAMSCLTCHYTHGNLDSTRPQASFSFMDRMVNAERLHKSFLLRRNNVDGELCLICHN